MRFKGFSAKLVNHRIIAKLAGRKKTLYGPKLTSPIEERPGGCSPWALCRFGGGGLAVLLGPMERRRGPGGQRAGPGRWGGPGGCRGLAAWLGTWGCGNTGIQGQSREGDRGRFRVSISPSSNPRVLDGGVMGCPAPVGPSGSVPCPPSLLAKGCLPKLPPIVAGG